MLSDGEVHDPEDAIAAARERFPRHAQRMRVADLADLAELELPSFDCLLLLNVLQCTSVDRDRLLGDLMPLLSPRARLLASIPNCHFAAGDIFLGFSPQYAIVLRLEGLA